MLDDFLFYLTFVGIPAAFIIGGMYWSIVCGERRNKGGN